MSSFRNAAAGVGLSFLSGCMDACSPETVKPEMEIVKEAISVKDPGSEEGRNKLIVDQMEGQVEDQVGGRMEGQVEDQVGGRIDEILEVLRKTIAADQTDPRAREFFGSSCAASFHNVDGFAYEKPSANKVDGYSIQELTSVVVENEFPRVTTVWGEYQNENWAGGFNVLSICIPSGLEKVAGKEAIKEMEEEFLRNGFKKDLDLSTVLNDDLIIKNTKVMPKKDLATGETTQYNMDSRVTVFMKK